MQELIMLMLGAAVVLVLWRTFKAFHDHGDSGFAVAASGFGPKAEPPAADMLRWPALGRFEFEVVESIPCQTVLRRAYEGAGEQCCATLHPGGHGRNTGAPVEVRVQGQRVGYLADGDATRFHRRLAYEGRPGQVSQCAARIQADDGGRRGDRRHFSIALDLKPFRH